MSDVLRTGVVGVGYLGGIHAKIYARMNAVELVAVADTDAETARRVAADCGCEAFTDSLDLLGKVDAVSVVVPTSRHFDVARPFLEQRIPMLLEKPIASTWEDARRLVDLARSKDVILQVGHLERFNAGVMELARRCENPRFIEAHRMSPFVARATDVDVVTDLMIHDIDIVLALVDSELADIRAVGVPVLTQYTDIANARLEFASGTVANITASRVSENKFRRFRVFSENRYEALNFVDQQIETLRATPAAAGEWPDIVRENVQVDPCMPLDAELEAFVNCVRHGQQPLVDGEVGLLPPQRVPSF